MKKKTVAVLLALSLTFVGCGNAKATNANVQETQQAQVQTQEQEIKQEQTQAEKNNQQGKDYGSFILYDEVINVDYEPNRTNLSPFQEGDKKYTLEKDTKIYDNSGLLAGYVKAGETITTFMNTSDEYASFHFMTEKDDYDIFLIKLEDIPDFTEKATKTKRVEKVETIEKYEEIGGVTPVNKKEAEKLQKFVDDENYYTYEEFWEKVNEKIAEKERVAQEYDYTDKIAPVKVDENKEEFEKISTWAPYLTKETADSIEISDTAENLWRLEEYYTEITAITDEYVEWELWGKTKEEYK